jgi:hypothetical protein
LIPLDIEQLRIIDQINVPALKKFVLKIQLIFVGGSVESIGIKKDEYTQEKYNNRDVIPITIEKLNLNAQQIAFYKKELIPLILKVFSETHEKYLADERNKRNCENP